MLWVNVWCHLQYGLPFISCIVGILWPSGSLSYFSLSNKSNICSVLLMSKSNPLAGPCCFTHLQDTGPAERAHSDTATSWSSGESSTSSVSTRPIGRLNFSQYNSGWRCSYNANFWAICANELYSTWKVRSLIGAARPNAARSTASLSVKQAE